jgi:hypothetical protein
LLRYCQILSVFQSIFTSIYFRCGAAQIRNDVFRICIRILLQVSDPTECGSGSTTLLGGTEILFKTTKEKIPLTAHSAHRCHSSEWLLCYVYRINNKRTYVAKQKPLFVICKIYFALRMRGLTSMVRCRLRSLSVQAESRLRSSSLAAWDLNRTQHVTENYAFTAFQILQDQNFNSINQPSIFIYFLAGYSVLATPSLMSSILYFWEMSGFEPRELP